MPFSESMRVTVAADSCNDLDEKSRDSYLGHSDCSPSPSSSLNSTDSEQKQDKIIKKIKKIGKRVKYTPKQIEILKSFFMKNKQPDRAVLEELGVKIGVSTENVKDWFRNRRIREERMKDEKTCSEKKGIFTTEQLSVLQSFYDAKVYPDSREYRELEMKLNIPEKNLKDWFARRRKKEKKLKGRTMSKELQKLKDRIVFMPEELEVLESSYNENKHPHITVYGELAIIIGVPEKNVRMWFEYRRRKERKIRDKITRQGGSLEKKESISYTPKQIQILESLFSRTIYPSAVDYQELEVELNVSEKNIKDWFARRREKEKRLKGPMMYLSHNNQESKQYPQLNVISRDDELFQLLDDIFDESSS